MRKICAVLLCLSMLLGITCVATAATVENSQYTGEIIADFNDKDGAFENETNGWFFYGEGTPVNFTDGKLVVSDLVGFLQLRIDLDEAAKALTTAELCNGANGIGFYFENNTIETCGVSYFGEITNTDNDSSHQSGYQDVEYTDVVAYLVDQDGNITRGEEYYDDYGHGCTEVPAGFKGYILVTFEGMGHSYCSYEQWGFHPDYDCQSGLFVKGKSAVSNVGIAIHSIYCDEDENFTIDDFMLVTFNENFNPGETTTTEPTGQVTEQPGVTGSPTVGTNASDTPSTPNEPLSTGAIIAIAVGAVVVIAAIVTIVVVAKKKKKD